MNNVMRKEFIIGELSSDGKPIESTERTYCVLFNKTRISEKEVEELIRTKNYNDKRIVVTTPEKADNLRSV